MIEKAMGEVGYSVKTDKPAKAQALELIKRLSEGDVLPIRRVRMRVRVTIPGKDGKRIGDKIKGEGEIEEEDMGLEWEVVGSQRRHPAHFRPCK
jgi:ribosome maturation protein SDO1